MNNKPYEPDDMDKYCMFLDALEENGLLPDYDNDKFTEDEMKLMIGMSNAMTLKNPLWDEFTSRLGKVAGNCNSKDHHLALEILNEIGLSREAIKLSDQYFNENGGYCDCEILMNIACRE